MSEAITERPVLKAIAAIMADVGSVEKKGTNTFHNYAYATAADIAHALQKRMAAAGLIIVPHQKSFALIAQDSVLTMDFQFLVMHVSGDTLPYEPVFTGMSSCRNTKDGFDDKAANKCLTAATKYFTLALFRIPTGDYHDSDAEPDKPANGNGKAVSKKGRSNSSIYEPDERGSDDPFPDISGRVGVGKYKNSATNADVPANYTFLEAAIRAQRTIEDLNDWGNDPTNQAAIAQLPAEWVPNIRNEFKDRLMALKEAA